MKEPYSTFSCIAYIAAGLLALTYDPLQVYASITVIFLGVGSALFHATGKRFHQHLDVFGMYLTFSALMILNIGGSEMMIIPAFLIGFLSFFARDDFTSDYIVGGLALFAIAMWIPGHSLAMIISVLGLFGFAVLLRKKWNNDIIHSIWHLLTASGIYLLMI